MKCEACPVQGGEPCAASCEGLEFLCIKMSLEPEIFSNHIILKSKIGCQKSKTQAVYPSLGRQLANAAGAVARVATAAVTGQKILATPEERARRLAVCQGDSGSPPCHLYDVRQKRCAGCGCVGSIKTLLETETGKCPLGKW